MVKEVRQHEEVTRSAKAVSLAKPGAMDVVGRCGEKKISWRVLWEIEVGKISFTIRTTYDPKNYIFFHHQRISISDMARIQPVPSAHHNSLQDQPFAG